MASQDLQWKLNEVDPEHVHLYAPTDTRFRPDQRWMSSSQAQQTYRLVQKTVMGHLLQLRVYKLRVHFQGWLVFSSRHLEEGRIQDAEKEKQRVEQLQRMERKNEGGGKSNLQSQVVHVSLGILVLGEGPVFPKTACKVYRLKLGPCEISAFGCLCKVNHFKHLDCRNCTIWYFRYLKFWGLHSPGSPSMVAVGGTSCLQDSVSFQLTCHLTLSSCVHSNCAFIWKPHHFPCVISDVNLDKIIRVQKCFVMWD